MASGSYPEWITNESERRLHDDLIMMVWLVWKHLKLPDPTRRQRAMCRYLQHGPKRRMLQAFRGVGKTWLTCVYAIWRLYRNPQERVKIVSANEAKATENAAFIRRLIEEIPQLAFLRPHKGGRDSVLVFDVGPAQASVTPSVSALGITGQLTGGRASILISDDIEVQKNSYTEGMRERLSELVKEYDALVVPEGFDIVYLGTPQTESSVYNTVRKRGYDCRIWPARFPDAALASKYDGALAPDVVDDIKAGSKVGTSTDPERFTDLDLAEREGSYGRSGFSLQFMLDTTLSDAERYPLKQADLVYFDCAMEDAPVRLAWTSDPRNAVTDVVNLGFSGDRLYRPMHVSPDRAKYQGAVLVIDPSGRGKDQTAAAVLKSLHGMIFLTAISGARGGYTPENLQALADMAKLHQVKHVLIESNFGDGMFTKLLEPVMAKTHPCTIEEYRSVGQKEARIIEDLEPIMNQHRLVIDSGVIKAELAVAESEPKYSLLYQLTHITKERGALRHEDKLEVVSRGCRYFREQLGQDHQRAELAHRERLRNEEFKRYEQAALGPGAQRRRPTFVQRTPGVLRKRPSGAPASPHWASRK